MNNELAILKSPSEEISPIEVAESPQFFCRPWINIRMFKRVKHILFEDLPVLSYFSVSKLSQTEGNQLIGHGSWIRKKNIA